MGPRTAAPGWTMFCSTQTCSTRCSKGTPLSRAYHMPGFLFRICNELANSQVAHAWTICMRVCRYDNPAIALNCGSMLRDCVRSEVLAK